MPTIIDSLLVKLGFDATDFARGKTKVDQALKTTGEEADKTGAKLKKTGKDAAEGFNEVTQSAIKFLAVIGGTMAVKRFAEQIIESSSALDRLSKNLGESATEVSAWSNAAELAGGSAEGLQGTMDMLSKSQTELMLTGQSSLIPYFSALGMSLADASGKARPISDILLDLSDRFSHMDRTTANNMGRMLGIDQGTMQLLHKGRTEIELVIARQKEYNALTKQQAEGASRLKLAMVESKQSFEAFGRELLNSATPALEKVFSVLSGLGRWIRDNSEFVQNFLIIIATGITAISASAITLNPVVAGIFALSAALAGLWQDYQTFERGGETLIPWKKWMPGINAAINGIKSLAMAIVDAGYRMAAFIDMSYQFATGNTSGAKKSADAMMQGMPSQKESAAQGGKSAVDPKEFFKSKGWSEAQATGIVANLSAESKMKSNAVGDHGAAYGIAQWHAERQENFHKWAGKNIRDSSLEEQLEFVNYELTQGNYSKAGASLRNAVTAQKAGDIVSRLYEQPKNVEGEASKRGLLARNMMLGIAGAGNYAAYATPSRLASAPNVANSRSSEVNIGEVKVYSSSQDGAGLGKDMVKSLDYLFTAQANGGLF